MNRRETTVPDGSPWSRPALPQTPIGRLRLRPRLPGERLPKARSSYHAFLQKHSKGLNRKVHGRELILAPSDERCCWPDQFGTLEESSIRTTNLLQCGRLKILGYQIFVLRH